MPYSFTPLTVISSSKKPPVTRRGHINPVVAEAESVRQINGKNSINPVENKNCPPKRMQIMIQYEWSGRKERMQTMNSTHVRPCRDLRNNYAELAKIVNNDHDQVIITNNGRGEAVLIGFRDYAEYENYLHEKYVDEKLKEAEEYAKRPDAVWHSKDAVIAMLMSDDDDEIHD